MNFKEINLLNKELRENEFNKSIKLKSELMDIDRIKKNLTIKNSGKTADVIIDNTKTPSFDIDNFVPEVELMDAETTEKIYKIIKSHREQLGVQKSIKDNANELSIIVSNYHVYFCEDTDPETGQCKIEYEMIFKNGYCLIIRFIISYLLIKENKKSWYDFGEKTGNKIEKHLLLFDVPNNKTNSTNTRGNKISENIDFTQEQLLDNIKTILLKNDKNVNNHNIQLMQEFIRTVVSEKIPKSKYFKNDMVKTLKKYL